MIKNDEYQPKEYREFIANNYSLDKQINATKQIIISLIEAKEVYKTNIRYPINNKLENLSCEPFFIVGSGRSGNTLLRAMLTAHKQVSIPPESYVFPIMLDRFIKQNGMDWNSLVCNVLKPLEDSPDFYTWGIDLTLLKNELYNLNEKNKTFSRIIDKLYSYYAKEKFPGSTMWGDKTPLNTFHLEEINLALPNSKYIHVIRDGRDVVSSYLKAGIYDSVEKASSRWWQSIEQARLFGKNSESSKYIEVRYENLVSNPLEELQRVSSFLNIHFEKEMLDFFKIYDKLGDTVLAHHNNVQNPVNPNSIGK